MEDFKYARSFKDRHGHVRWRFRGKGIEMYLPGSPGDEEFRLAYEAASDGRKPNDLRLRASSAPSYIRPALKRAKTRAARQGVPFELDEMFLKDLFDKQDWRCAVSAIRFPLRPANTRNQQAFRPSVDRIKPEVGYVPGNVRVVCEIVNLAMNNWGEGPLRTLVRQMGKNRVSM